MGSFCISCGVSGQTIADDDKCWVVPILQGATHEPVALTFGEKKFSMFGAPGSTTSPGEQWSPVGGFIEGVYADYGRVQPVDTPRNRLLMLDFFRTVAGKSASAAEGKNSAHDIAFDFAAFLSGMPPTLASAIQKSEYAAVDAAALAEHQFEDMAAIWDYVWHAAWESRLFCMDNIGRMRPLQFAAFHGVTFDHLVGHAQNLKNLRGEPYDLPGYLEKNVRSFPDLKPSQQESRAAYSLRESLRLGMNDGLHALLYPFWDEQEACITEYLKGQISLKELAQKLWNSMEGVYALKAMDELNLKFTPYAYAGQDYSNEQGKALAKFISKVSKQVSADADKKYND